MKIAIDKRQADILAQAERFAQEVLRPAARQNDEAGAFPPESIAQMGQLGLLGATLPARYGGLELDPLGYGLLVQAIEQGDSAASRLLTVHVALASEALNRYASEEQKERLLPSIARGESICAFALTEPEHGSDAAGITTSYSRHGSDYCLNGTKKWISFAGIASHLIVIARSGDTRSAFLVGRDTPGVVIRPIQGLLAGRACHISTIELNDAVVGPEALIGAEGQGFAYIVNSALDYGRYSVAWGAIGLAQAALDAMVDYSKRRSQFGSKLSKHQMIRAMLADAATDIYAGRSLCLRAAASRTAKSPDGVIEAAIAKQFAARIAFRIASDAVQLHGGNGCYNEYPAERYMREAKTLEIIEGTTQIQQMVISLHALRNGTSPLLAS